MSDLPRGLALVFDAVVKISRPATLPLLMLICGLPCLLTVIPASQRR